MNLKIGIGLGIILFIILFWVGIKVLFLNPNKCEKVSEVEILNFSEEQIITITPYENCNNLGYIYTLKGEISNDIIIDNRLYKKGKIDTLIKDIDYYGGHSMSIKIQKKSNVKGYIKIKQTILGV